LSLILNGSFTVFEFVAGILTGSLALISDAGHNLAHAFIILVSLFSLKFSKRQANIKHTYGFERTSILAAEFNTIILTLLAFYIFYEAIRRIFNPEPVSGLAIIVVSFIGILVNGTNAALFRNYRHDLNIRSIFVNLSLDAVALGGAFLAGVIIFFTKITIIDSYVGIFISCIILTSSWRLMGKAVHVLMEGVPEGIDPEKIKLVITSVSAVKKVDHLHVWGISSEVAALSCHITLENCDLKKSTKIVKKIKNDLNKKFNFAHITIETKL